MQKSVLFKVGAGTVLAGTVTASTFLISTFLPSADLVTVSQARFWTIAGVVVLLVGIPLAIVLWLKGSKSSVIENRQLVGFIPALLTDMHNKKGK